MNLPKFAVKSYQHIHGYMLNLDICKGICIFVNKDFKEIYVAIHDNKAVYANTNPKWFIDGMKALDIHLGNGTIISVYDFAFSGKVHVDVYEHGLDYMDGLSIHRHERKTFPADKETRGFDCTTLKAKGKKVQVEFKTFHKPLEK